MQQVNDKQCVDGSVNDKCSDQNLAVATAAAAAPHCDEENRRLRTTFTRDFETVFEAGELPSYVYYVSREKGQSGTTAVPGAPQMRVLIKPPNEGEHCETVVFDAKDKRALVSISDKIENYFMKKNLKSPVGALYELRSQFYVEVEYNCFMRDGICKPPEHACQLTVSNDKMKVFTEVMGSSKKEAKHGAACVMLHGLLEKRLVKVFFTPGQSAVPKMTFKSKAFRHRRNYKLRRELVIKSMGDHFKVIGEVSLRKDRAGQQGEVSLDSIIERLNSKAKKIWDFPIQRHVPLEKEKSSNTKANVTPTAQVGANAAKSDQASGVEPPHPADVQQPVAQQVQYTAPNQQSNVVMAQNFNQSGVPIVFCPQINNSQALLPAGSQDSTSRPAQVFVPVNQTPSGIQPPPNKEYIIPPNSMIQRLNIPSSTVFMAPAQPIAAPPQPQLGQYVGPPKQQVYQPVSFPPSQVPALYANNVPVQYASPPYTVPCAQVGQPVQYFEQPVQNVLPVNDQEAYVPEARGQEAYDQGAYAQGAYDQGKYNKQTYEQQEYNARGYGVQANNPQAYDQQAYASQAYNPQAYNPPAHNPSAYNPHARAPRAYGQQAVFNAQPTPGHHPTPKGQFTVNDAVVANNVNQWNGDNSIAQDVAQGATKAHSNGVVDIKKDAPVAYVAPPRVKPTVVQGRTSNVAGAGQSSKQSAKALIENVVKNVERKWKGRHRPPRYQANSNGVGTRRTVSPRAAGGNKAIVKDNQIEEQVVEHNFDKEDEWPAIGAAIDVKKRASNEHASKRSAEPSKQARCCNNARP